MGNGARRLRGWPVRLLIAGLAVAAIFLVAAVLIALSWMNSRNLLLDAAARTANDAAQITFEHTRRMIEPASATLRTLSFDPIVSAPRLQDRLERMRLLAEELAANPLISALYVGYDNGDFLLARMLDDPGIRQHFGAPGQARFLVQTVTRAADGTAEGDFLFYDGGLSPITRRSEADYRYDPRERPWYANAGEGAALTISAPYVFFSTRQVGVSLSRRAEGGKAIVGLDIVLDDLGRMLDELRITPSAELALVDGSGAVVAYRDPRVLTARALAAGDTHLRPLDDLGVEPLSDLRRIARDGRPVSYDVAGHEWLGVMLPFDGFDNVDIRLLLTAPADELLGDLQHDRQRMVLITGGLILLFLGLGWWGGSRIGRALERTTAQAKRMSAFDFSRPPDAPAWLRETRELNGVMDNVSNTVEAFLAISDVLGAEPRIETMLAQVLEKFVHATRCRSGAIYLLQKDSQTMARAAVAGDAHGLEESLPCAGGGDAAPAAGAADGLQRVQFELRSRAGRVEGLLVLRHAQDQDHAAPGFQAFAFRLTGMLSAAIETRQLIESQKQLFDAVIRVLADAIDAKSPYTGGHCERVPALAIMMTDRMCADTSGPYADFTFTEDERYVFYLAAWLHDCGKITSAEHIVDKATKLEVIYNRIHEIRMRFEVLWRDAEIAHLRACLDGQPAAASAQARDERQAQLQDDFRFVAECNLGGEFLADEAIERLRRLGQATWLRHFDDGLGLAAAERRRLEGSRAGAPALPAIEPLLADKPQHRVEWGDNKPAVERDDPRNALGFDMKLPAYRQDMGELHNLSIRRGTLTDEDRFAINDHIVQTLIMLKQLPWPRHLERVPDIAANHHEKMDGTGYPRRLPGEALHLTERVMAVADVFEALTAADRPYKLPKTLSESLRIMAVMCKERHLDTELYLYFLRSRIWLAYAQQHMNPSQIDDVDIEALARIAQG